jgi:hypothetical protein
VRQLFGHVTELKYNLGNLIFAAVLQWKSGRAKRGQSCSSQLAQQILWVLEQFSIENSAKKKHKVAKILR